MNKTLYIILTATLSLLIINDSAKADSPLTSIDLATPYQDIEIVSETLNNKKLDVKVLKFLLSNAPLDEKAAVINALGWNFDGQNNASLFLIALVKSKNIKLSNLTLNDLNASDKFVLGYLLAMDDYFYLSPIDKNINQFLGGITPTEFLSQAIVGLPNNFTIHFINSLIEAQKNMESSWCNVYQIPESVLIKFPERKRNLRQKAIDNAMDYINLYAEYCDK
ncbi:hypothetical protein GM3708_888 [Geminocystis sp. NIES-3708]|uniref:hypothetical protein n=1 Tax=Geminocystis sp. NIES-3708 TaxID=1615909 RepID=UPI0005FC8ED5|nr:hypothetical protein [Geminocystis sp. NIES-3708]BAQ60482.1 hypothetical protein GM3708_888 [Geminocystis sp. NIES-3708]